MKLKQNIKGLKIIEIKTLLRWFGFLETLKNSEIFDKQTTIAISQFQRNYGILPTGIVDIETYLIMKLLFQRFLKSLGATKADFFEKTEKNFGEKFLTNERRYLLNEYYLINYTRINEPVGNRNISMIVIHQTDLKTESIETLELIHKRMGLKEVGCHFLIRSDGIVEMGRTLEKLDPLTCGFESSSINICIAGSNEFDWFPQKNQIYALRNLIKELRKTFRRIPVFLYKDLELTYSPGRISFEKI